MHIRGLLPPRKGTNAPLALIFRPRMLRRRSRTLRVRAAASPHVLERSTVLTDVQQLSYEAPQLIETFDAADFLGAAEGLTYGNGSGSTIISIPD